jgi:GntR family transcriptional regulator
MEKIADLPMLNDIDADYTPQYVKLARILREKIESGQYQHGENLPSAELTVAYEVSSNVVCRALAMLAANKYVQRRPGKFGCYQVAWQTVHRPLTAMSSAPLTSSLTL